MLGVLLIAQKFEHIFLLTETRKVELCRCWEFVSQMEESHLNYWRNIKLENAVGQEINPREIRLHLSFSANWNKRSKDWKKGNAF